MRRIVLLRAVLLLAFILLLAVPSVHAAGTRSDTKDHRSGFCSGFSFPGLGFPDQRLGHERLWARPGRPLPARELGARAGQRVPPRPQRRLRALILSLGAPLTRRSAASSCIAPGRGI
jgi:hypothetical protein